MKVAQLVDIGKIEIEDKLFLDGLWAKDTLQIKMKQVGICGSDLHYFRHGGLGTFVQEFPMPIGHEAVGIVNNPYDSSWFKKGDRVAIEPGRHVGHVLSAMKKDTTYAQMQASSVQT